MPDTNTNVNEASVIVKRDTKANIDLLPRVNGQMLWTTDSGEDNHIYNDILREDGTVERIQIGGILPETEAEIQQAVTDASASASSASTSATNASNSATLSESYAKGGTGTRTGEDTDNSKYYKEQADTSATNASTSASSASTSASNASASATQASASATNASNSATQASNNATLAESYAKGGTSTRQGEDTDNAKYYMEQAETYAEQASQGVPPATSTTLGVVKPDNTTITVDNDGTIHGSAQVDIATVSNAGIVKPDGTTITIDQDGTIHGSSSGNVDIATITTAGIVKPDGATIIVTNDGTITAKEIVPITQTDFDALTNKETNIAYFIRESASSTTGKIWYDGTWFGGTDGGSDVEIKTVNEWVLNSTYISDHSVIMALNNELHILGGDRHPTYHYKWDGTQWVSVSTLPYNFNGGSAVVYNNEIHILGGNSSGNYTKHYKWDGTQWTSVSTLPYDFMDSTAVVYNNEIHILGSYDNPTNHYKWNGSQWVSVSTLPYNFTEGCTVVLNNEIHILGSGTNHYKWNGTQWASASTLPYNFRGGSAVVLDNEIHILGKTEGGTPSGYGTSHYKWNGTQWTSVTTLPYDVFYQSAVILNNEINIVTNDERYYTLRLFNNKLFVNDQPVNAENVLTDEQLTKLNESLNLQETTALITEMTGGKTVVTSVLHSTDWSQGVYSFESTYPSSTYDIEQIQPYGDIDQVSAWNEADIVGNPNSNILACRGTVPSIDISIMYYVRRKQVN